MFQNKRSLFCLVATSAIFIAGCGLNDMHDKTLEMADTTKDMAQTTKGMSKTTDHMSTTTDGMAKTTEKMSDGMDKTLAATTGMGEKMDKMYESTSGVLAPETVKMGQRMAVMEQKTNFLYADNRPGASGTFRAQRLDSLRAASNMGAKLSEGAKYFRAFEFQLWKAYDSDNVEKRLALLQDATDEFFREVQQFFKFEKVPMSNDQKNIYALASTMHFKDPAQEVLAKDKNFPPISMLDMIEATLKYKADINSGKIAPSKMPAYMDSILLHEEFVVKLLKARQNFMLLMTYGKIVNMDENSFNGIFGQIAAKFRALPWLVTWKAPLYKKNVIQVLNYNRYVRASLRSRKILLDAGYNADLEKGMVKVNLKKLYKNMNILSSDPKGGQVEVPLKKSIAEFSALRDLLLLTDADFLKVDPASYACTELVCGEGYGVIAAGDSQQ